MTPRERFLLIVPGVLFLVAFGAFELGRLAAAKEAARKYAAETEEAAGGEAPRDDAALIDALLSEGLDERTFVFPAVIKGATGRTVNTLDASEAVAAVILEAIRSATTEAIAAHNRETSPVRSLRRINEASRFFEESIREHIDAHPDLFCTIPLNADGKEQRTGYPDLRIEHVESGQIAYLDPKLYESGSRDSSLRTFYYTPNPRTSKVLEDAHHLVVGISHDGKDGQWTFGSWELIDLAKLNLQLRPAFEAGNRDLYRDEAILARSGEDG